MPTNPRPVDLFNSVWSYDLANNTIAVSWWQLGDVRKLSEAQFEAVCAKEYPWATPKTQEYIRSALLRFHGIDPNGIQMGDVVVACRGRSAIVGVGRVAGDSYYDEARGLVRIGAWTQHRGPHFLPMTWTVKKELPIPRSLVFPRTTFSELSAERANAVFALTGGD